MEKTVRSQVKNFFWGVFEAIWWKFAWIETLSEQGSTFFSLCHSFKYSLNKNFLPRFEFQFFEAPLKKLNFFEEKVKLFVQVSESFVLQDHDKTWQILTSKTHFSEFGFSEQ